MGDGSAWSYLVILGAMKTAISVPDDTFARATVLAAALGMSRSELFTRAAQRYIEQFEAEAVTREIDVVLERLDDDDSTRAAVASGRALLSGGEEGW